MQKVVTEKVVLEEKEREFLKRVDEFFSRYCGQYDECENCPLFTHDDEPCGREQVDESISILLA